MKRRSFLKLLAGAALAVAALPIEFKQRETLLFDPIKYQGDFHWRHIIDPNPPRYQFNDREKIWELVKNEPPYFHAQLSNPDWVDAPREEIWWHPGIPENERILPLNRHPVYSMPGARGGT
jgi:hypothetical protein